MNTPVSTVLRSFCIFLAFAHGVQLPAQDDSPTADDVAAEAADVQKQAPEIDVAEKVEVNPTNSDGEIEVRLREIFEATGWFESAEVRVDGGVAFLSGTADSVKHQQWAEATARTVVNVQSVATIKSMPKCPYFFSSK